VLRGFLSGTLTLIVLYVVVQPGASSKTEQAGGVLVAGMRRWLSSGVAGVPDRTKKAKKTPTAATASVGRFNSTTVV